MFYSQDLLQKRGGKFGIVWVAATQDSNLNRRDYAKINVAKTCDDIIAYILLRAPAVRVGGARPRLSLYLSAQLMFGAVKIYGKQCLYLLNDTSSLSTKFDKTYSTGLDIDIKTLPRIDVDLALDFGMAFTPDFGNLKSPEFPLTEDIVVFDHISVRMPFLEESSEEKPIKTPSPRFSAVLGSPLQAPVEAITLTEAPFSPTLTVQVPGEKDLPILPGDPEMEHLVTADEDKVTSDEHEEHPVPMETTITDLDHGRLAPAEETVGPMLPSLLEEPGAPHAKRGRFDVSPHITPPTTPEALRLSRVGESKRERYTMELTPLSPTPTTRKRRRQLLFVDQETQIDRQLMRRYLESGERTSHQRMILPDIRPAAQDLFTEPGREDLRRTNFAKLWRRNAISHDFLETDSQRGRIAWTVPDLESSTSSEQEIPDMNLPAVETERARGEVTRREEISMETAEIPRLSSSVNEPADDLARSFASLGSADEQHSPHVSATDLSVSHRSYRRGADQSTLEEPSEVPLATIVEGLEDHDVHLDTEKMTTVTEEVESDPTTHWTDVHQSLIRLVIRLTDQRELTTFRQVCPPETRHRQDGATYFSALLDLCAEGQLFARQKAPFSDIYIGRK